MAAIFFSAALAGRRPARQHRAATTVRSAETLEGHNRRQFLDDISCVDGAGTVVVDLRPLRFFDAAGLRALVTAVRRVHDQGGRIWMRCAPGPVAARLAETGLGQLVAIEMVCTRTAGGRAAGPARRRAGQV